MSQIKVAIAAHPFTASSYAPIKCLNIDFIGPFPDGGYVLTVIDTFSRWLELYHSVDNTYVGTYDTERTEFLVDSYVLTTCRGNKDNVQPTRLHTKLRGPMRVIRYTGSEYTLLDLVTQKENNFHVKQLRAFDSDPEVKDPQEIASRDYQEFVVARSSR